MGYAMIEHIHTPRDGRGPRRVLVDGREVKRCLYADTRRGIVDCYRYPLKLHKYRKRAITQRLRGVVEVLYD